MSKKTPLRVANIGSLILTIRGKRVIADSDLASIYGVSTKRLNEQVRRNAKRFPTDFMYQLTSKEAQALMTMRSQIATAPETTPAMRSQFATAYKRNVRFLPHVFTENGAVMAANVLNSPEAVRMSVFVVRAFVKMRELLGGTKELARQLAELERKLTARLDGHEIAIVEVLQRIMRVLDPPPPPPEPETPKRRIGFHVEPEAKSENKARKMA